MIARMDRVEVVFLRSELQAMVSYLQEQGVLHVETVPLAMDDFPGFLHRVHLPEPEKAELDDLQQLQQLLREALPLLSQQPGHAAVVEAGIRLEKEGLNAWRDELRATHRTLRGLSRRKLNARDTQELLRNYKRILQNIAPIMRERKLQLGENVRIVVLQGQAQEAIRELEKRFISEIGADCELIGQPLTKTEMAVIVRYPEGKNEAVGALLKQEEISTVELQDREIRDASADQVVSKIDRKLEGLSKDLEELDEEIRGFSKEHGAELAASEQMVTTRIAQLNVVEHLAQSTMVSVVQGWVPADSFDALVSGVQQQFGAKAAVARLPEEEIEHGRIPTLLKNPKILKPFELILKLFAPPTYGHLDPTGLVAVSFVLFYGFIMGDAGYALVIGAAAWWAKKKWDYVEAVRDAMTIALWMAGSSFIFGIIYGEFFGNLPELFFGLHGPFYRAQETTILLGIAVAVGAVHIPLALILGIKEDFQHHHTKHAYEKLAMLLGLVSLALALTGVTALYAVAAVLFAVALVFFVKGMGVMAPMGVMEILSLSSNVLSYSRLMALGVASFALADIANDLPEMLGVVFGTVMALVVHALNIGIGVFSPTIHSLRLNYVEFLPKFYDPAGREYQPFRKEVVW